MADSHASITGRKRLVLCADDYGITAGVSRSIRELLAARRLSATSVMAGMPSWPSEAQALKAVAGDADIGLHVTLTDQVPLGAMPTAAPGGRLPSKAAVYKKATLRRLPLDEMSAELDRQYAAFVTHWDRPPAHIDGHHHVHQLPGIREHVIALARRAGPTCWVRDCAPAPRDIWRRRVAVTKAFTIASFGVGFGAAARTAGVPTNADFAGAYDLAPDTDLAPLFARFLDSRTSNHLVMCHPGFADAELAAIDPMTTARDAEHAFLMSDAWLPLVAAAGFELGPLRRSGG
jgi:hypothetical protein